LFVLVLLVVVFVHVGFVVDFEEFEHGTGFGEVEAFGGGFDGADLIGGVGVVVEASGVVAGDLEAVEQGCSSFGVKLAGSEAVDDDGEGDLDGFAVFEGGEFDVLAGDEVVAGSGGVAEAAVSLVEAVVEVAVDARREGRGSALESVGFDVTADWILHCVLSSGLGYHPIARL
jgi:hypothetical protein